MVVFKWQHKVNFEGVTLLARFVTSVKPRQVNSFKVKYMTLKLL